MTEPRIELEKWEKCDSCDNLGMVYEYNCRKLFCRTDWNQHQHRFPSYRYYVRGSINKAEEIP